MRLLIIFIAVNLLIFIGVSFVAWEIPDINPMNWSEMERCFYFVMVATFVLMFNDWEFDE